MAKKLLIWFGIAVLVFSIAFRPQEVVDVVRTLGRVFLSIGELVTW